MKKFLVVLWCCFFIMPTNIYAQENVYGKNAKAVLLMDNDTGTILYEKNSNDRLSVASMTKMVAQIIIMEHIENGNLSWDEEVTVSLNAAAMGGSQIWLEANERMTVRDLMKGITMASANDATVALAERIAGNEADFVKLMNEKVKKLGLKNTNFVNSTGLDENNHYSSAYDMAVIARELLKHEEILEISSVYEDYLRNNQFWLVNTNKLVRFYNGADGLKTGFTDDALYCMAVTAKRENMRLIAIVLGEEVANVRNQETMELLDYGFNTYKMNVIKKKEDVIKTIKLTKSTIPSVNIILSKDVSILQKKSEPSIAYETKVELKNIKLPLKKNDIVGKLLVLDNGKVIDEVNLIVNQDVYKLNWLSLFYKTVINIITFNIF